MTTIALGSRIIDKQSKPYIIAEIGVNHEGSMPLAKRLIELAKEGGADAAKFQSYKAETLASKHSPAYWDMQKEPARNQFELFKRYDVFEASDYIELAHHCDRVGIDFLSTPFDDKAIEFLDPIVPFFKIASADLTNTPFLRKIAAKKKPVVLSTGAATLSEIDTALQALTQENCHDVVLLHCILNYPTMHKNASLRMIKGLMRVYPERFIGYSDHTLPDEVMLPVLTAHILGAVVLEKHFTHDKTLPGNDHYHAMDVLDLKRLTYLIDDTHDLFGESDYKAPIASEQIARLNARRSIVLTKDMVVGQKLTVDDVTYKRPGTGISPQYWDEIIGREIKRTLNVDQILSWEDLV